MNSPTITSSSSIIKRMSSGYYAKHTDPQPTQRPYMSEQVYHPTHTRQEIFPKPAHSPVETQTHYLFEGGIEQLSDRD